MSVCLLQSFPPPSSLPVIAGSNSEQVLSGPRAWARIFSLLAAFKRLSTSPEANSSFKRPTGFVAVLFSLVTRRSPLVCILSRNLCARAWKVCQLTSLALNSTLICTKICRIDVAFEQILETLTHLLLADQSSYFFCLISKSIPHT